MEIRTLKYFMAVAEERNLTHAAERLHIAQPSLTKQLKILEEELGTSLFVRGKRGMEPTREGEYLYRQGKQILELVSKTEGQLKEMQEGLQGTLYISAVETVGNSLMPEWLAGFHKKYPEVTYKVWNGNTDDVLERLRSGLTDMVIARAPFDKNMFDGILLGEDEWVAVMNHEHPLAKKSGTTVTLNELSDQKLILAISNYRADELKKWFQGMGKEPQLIAEFAPLMSGITLAACGIGVAILPGLSVSTLEYKDDVVIKHIEDLDEQTQYALIWRKHDELSGVSRQFINHVKTEIKKQGKWSAKGI